jgi:hypothetical protein
MATLTATRPARQRKPATRVRTCRLAHTDGGPALVIRQQEGKGAVKVDAYFLAEIAAAEGRGFEVRKHDGTQYHTIIKGQCGPDGENDPSTCDCPGALKWGHRTRCKHIASLRKLIAEKRLKAPRIRLPPTVRGSPRRPLEEVTTWTCTPP